MPVTIAFVHGYSVTNFDPYGELPLRLREEARLLGLDLEVENIFLGRYISFHDEVRVSDISRAFKTAVNDQLQGALTNGGRFICITHSTGGPVIRDWVSRYYSNGLEPCPMSHLIMLAPANFGSALAQLGKGKLSRLKSWFNNVEPGQGVLDWLELGSNEAWDLNKEWIQSDGAALVPAGVFPFCLIGQSIDRKLYDILNSYTGEIGSDGVVRVAAANLNSRYIRLEQSVSSQDSPANLLEVGIFKESPPTAFRVIANKSHTGDKMGIVYSVEKEVSDTGNSETIRAIFDCMKVATTEEYQALCVQFEEETKQVQENEKVEIEKRLLLSDRYFIHDRYSMVIFRVMDHEGRMISDYDLVLTAGEDNDPNKLPEGFFSDRQQNKVNRSAVTYFFNYDIMRGTAEIKNDKGDPLCKESPGIDMLGFQVRPRPDDGFVRYLPCEIHASKDLLEQVLKPNSTTLIEICLQRVVSKEVFRQESFTGDDMPGKRQSSFKDKKPGKEIVE